MRIFIRLTAVYLAIALVGCYMFFPLISSPLTLLSAQTLFCQPVSSFWNPFLAGESALNILTNRAAKDCHNPDVVNVVYCVLTVSTDALGISPSGRS